MVSWRALPCPPAPEDRPMRLTPLVLTSVLLPAWTHPAEAADLAKLDRTILKEPTYKDKPRYCLLVFGKEARTRTWLVVDGQTVYLDRDGHGDLTEAGERVSGTGSAFQPVSIDPGGRESPYRVTHISLMKLGKQDVVLVGSQTRGKFKQYGDALLADRPPDAPVLHFDGPLAMFLERRPLGRGERASTMRVGVATVTSDRAGVF